jgi:hypothetical protein
VIRTAVVSTQIKSVGYDAGSRTLEIEFHRGGLYQYVGVPAYVYEGLLNAPSKGQYFRSFIGQRYWFTRMN